MRSSPVLVSLNCQFVKNENDLGDEPLGVSMDDCLIDEPLGVSMDDCLIDGPLGCLWRIILSRLIELEILVKFHNLGFWSV